VSSETKKETPAERKRRLRAMERAANDAATLRALEHAKAREARRKQNADYLARRREVSKAPSVLFGGHGEGRSRLGAVLDALDFVACEDRDGWIRLATWAGRLENAGISRTPATAERLWSRKIRRLRAHGIEVVALATSTADGGDGAGSTGMNQKDMGAWIQWERTAIRLTPEGEDRLRALVAALDAWLVARADAGELVDEESA